MKNGFQSYNTSTIFIFAASIIGLAIFVIAFYIIKKFESKNRSKSIQMKDFTNYLYTSYFQRPLTANSIVLNGSDPDYLSFRELKETVPLIDHVDFDNFKGMQFFKNLVNPYQSLLVPAEKYYGFVTLLTLKYDEFRYLFNITDPTRKMKDRKELTSDYQNPIFYYKHSKFQRIAEVAQRCDNISAVPADEILIGAEFVSSFMNMICIIE